MPETDRLGGAGRPALLSYLDDDFQAIVDAVNYLPEQRRLEGADFAIDFLKVEVRALVSELAVARLDKQTALQARSGLAVFYRRGPARLLTDPDVAGDRFRTLFLEVIEREVFEAGVQAVFERSVATQERAYVPNVPRD